ncbi:MAG: hypothetical protein LBF77_02310 [Spirochaetaceae bacterium]|nr:hypothetical protein [Spirochaetaceae bacterium]
MGDTTVQSREPPRRVTFEEAWAMIQETGRQLKEMSAETDRQIKEMSAETDRQLKEMGAETDRRMAETDQRMKETDRKIGRLGSRLGDVIEHIMSPKLHEKFEKLGFSFNHSSRNHELKDRNKNRLAEVDILLENGEQVMAVEVKTHLTTEDVRDHIKRMETLRRVADEHNDTRKYLGAVAGAVVDQEVLAYALKNGFYVITPSGETVDIEAPDSRSLRIW